MSYEQDLTFQLRMRGLSEDDITDILRELAQHGADDVALREEFGTPEEYASGFGTRKRKTVGGRIVAITTALALTWIAAWIIVALVRRFVGIDPAMEGVIETWQIIVGALAIAVIGLVTGFVTDYVRPAKSTGNHKGHKG